MKFFLINHLNYQKQINKIGVCIDEFLFKYLKKKNIKFINSINSLSTLSKKDKLFILDKTKKYIKELGNSLNQIHNIRQNYKFWSVLVLHCIVFAVNEIYRDFRSLNKIKKKFKKIYLFEKNIKLPYLDTFKSFAYFKEANRNEYIKFIRYTIAKNIGIKVNNLEIKFVSSKFKYEQSSLLDIITSKIIKFYIFLAKPYLFFDMHVGKKKSIEIFFKSFGKILFVPSNYFFLYKNSGLKQKYNLSLRSKIKVKEHDLFDQIFNQILVYIMPMSLVENFNNFYSFNNKILNKINKVGTSQSLSFIDGFKFFAARIKSKGGKLILGIHGGEYGLKNFFLNEIADKVLSDYFFELKKGFYLPSFLSNLEHKEQINFRTHPLNKILILPYNKYFYPQDHNAQPSNKDHFLISLNYNFFLNLDKSLKEKVIVKLAYWDSKYHKEQWKDKLKKNNQIFDQKNITSQDLFKRSKIVILDNLSSTAAFELMYLNKPFIVIENNFNNYKTKIFKLIKPLIRKNLIFLSAEKASDFLNKNFSNIDLWWKKISASDEYIKLKKNYFDINKIKNIKYLIDKIESI